MKQILFLITIALPLHYATSQIDISEAKRSNSRGMVNSFLVELQDVTAKEAQDQWKKFVRPYEGKTKYIGRNKEWITAEAKVASLSSTTVTIYAKILMDKNDPNVQTNVIIWFDTGLGFIDSEVDPERAGKAQDIVNEYAMNTSRHHAEQVVKVEQRALETLSRKLKELRREKRTYQKRMTDAERTISEMKKKIEVNELDQIALEGMIEEQEELIKKAEKNVKRFRTVASSR